MKVSQTDPASRWTADRSGATFYAYSTNYLIDTEAGIIMDVEGTPANRSFEVLATWLDHSQRPRPTHNQLKIVRKWKCCLHT